MINFLAKKTLDYLVKHNGTPADSSSEYEWLRYGVEIIYSSLVATVVILCISIVMKSFISGLLFILVFVTTRQYTGGFHANTFLACNLISAACFFTLIVLCKFTHRFFDLKWSILIALVELLIAIVIFPVSNKNKPIRSRFKYRMCKIVGLFLFVLYSVFGIYISMYNTEYGVTIQYTLHLIVGFGVIGFFQERRSNIE